MEEEEGNKPRELLGSAAMKSLNTKQGAWSNRSLWSLSEKRLVFTSKREEVTKIWIESLEEIISEYYPNNGEGSEVP